MSKVHMSVLMLSMVSVVLIRYMQKDHKPDPQKTFIGSAKVYPTSTLSPLPRDFPMSRDNQRTPSTVEITPFSVHQVPATPGLTETPYFTVSGELARNVALVRDYKPLPELESELFELCKAYEQLYRGREISLICVPTMFPLTQLVDTKSYTSGDLYPGVEEEIAEVIEKRPWDLAEFRWVERALRFLNLLAMKWEIVDAGRYFYRNSPTPSDPLLLHQYQLRQMWVFPMETIWLACQVCAPPLVNKLPVETVELGQRLQRKTVELIRIVASWNFNVNFQTHKNINPDICLPSEEERLFTSTKRKIAVNPHLLSAMGYSLHCSPEFPEVVKSVGQPTIENAARNHKSRPPNHRNEILTRQNKQKEVGFHLLELPHVLLACLERGLMRENMQFRENLASFERLFRVFDMRMTEFLMEKGREK